MVINIFLELPRSGATTLHEIQPNELLLFIKFYDPLKVALEYAGSLYVGRETYFGTILEEAKALASLHKDLEVTASKIVAVEPSIVICDIFAQSTPRQVNLDTETVIPIRFRMNWYQVISLLFNQKWFLFFHILNMAVIVLLKMTA